ncbi:MAG TPA: 3-deoxy-D-manno-octulosonic acid transferase, partial [Arachidicoccus sp.]
KNAVLYSEFLTLSQLPANINTIIIDSIGMLSRLYKYATICFVGGAFGEDGVHNVLEAAVYHKPVVFGPVYDKYLEAVQLEECGAAFSAENVLGLEGIFNDLFNDNDLYDNACNAAAQYIKSKSGATKQILSYIEQHILKPK